MSTKIGELYGCDSYMGQKKFIAGLECEIEAIPGGKAKPYAIFQCKEDHSLRNNGWEFVSIPEDLPTLVSEFAKLQAWLGLEMSQDPFSHRTSTHVHVNVSNLTLEQAKNMLMLYALYEEFFFAMVKPERRSNIHCVPLTETHLPMYYKHEIQVLREKWSKYSALNLLRLADLGTMEFRHLHGTGDVQEVETWLKVLENLWKLAQEVEINADTLSNENVLKLWFSTIFAPSEKSLMLKPALMNIIQNSLVDVKFSTLKD
jgi:hypothetical protein